MATMKMMQIINRDRKLAVLFSSIVVDGLILIALVSIAIMIVI